jgi:hypothetical protein
MSSDVSGLNATRAYASKKAKMVNFMLYQCYQRNFFNLKKNLMVITCTHIQINCACMGLGMRKEGRRETYFYFKLLYCLHSLTICTHYFHI